ncbi:MAG: hypothetical protein IPL83_13405 [Bdellovibrionales bacterium]|nr:hypothetical protein [Bdellovibrionales bacterium]
MKNYLVVILGLIATSSAIANPIDYSSLSKRFTRFQDSKPKDSAPKKLVAPPDDRVDLNENFLNRDYFSSDELVWTQPLQYLLNHIQESVTLPQTVLRTFISVAEKSLKPKENNYPISLDSYPEDSISRTFIQESISAAFYYLKGYYQLPHRMLRLLSDSSERVSPRVLSEVLSDSWHERGTIQVLLGDEGASGVSSLVTEYAKASERQLVQIHPRWNSDISDLAGEIQSHVRQGNAPILFFDQLGRHPAEVLEAVAALTENRALIGNASLIVSFKPDAFNMNNSHIKRIVSSSEAVHIVGHPRSWHYYADFIQINLPAALNQIARRNDHAKNLSLINEGLIVTELAKAAWELQEATGRSTFRDLQLALRSLDPQGFFDSKCGGILRFALYPQHNFDQAVRRYKSAVQKSLGNGID